MGAGKNAPCSFLRPLLPTTCVAGRKKTWHMTRNRLQNWLLTSLPADVLWGSRTSAGRLAPDMTQLTFSSNFYWNICVIIWILEQIISTDLFIWVVCLFYTGYIFISGSKCPFVFKFNLDSASSNNLFGFLTVLSRICKILQELHWEKTGS